MSTPSSHPHSFPALSLPLTEEEPILRWMLSSFAYIYPNTCHDGVQEEACPGSCLLCIPVCLQVGTERSGRLTCGGTSKKNQKSQPAIAMNADWAALSHWEEREEKSKRRREREGESMCVSVNIQYGCVVCITGNGGRKRGHTAQRLVAQGQKPQQALTPWLGS